MIIIIVHSMLIERIVSTMMEFAFESSAFVG